MDGDWMELGRWHQRRGAAASEALSSLQVQILNMSRTWPHCALTVTSHDGRWATQNITSKELLLSEFKFTSDSRTRFVTTTVRNHLQPSHIKSQSKYYFLYEKSILILAYKSPGLNLCKCHYCGTLMVSYTIDSFNWQINVNICQSISVIRGINCSNWKCFSLGKNILKDE